MHGTGKKDVLHAESVRGPSKSAAGLTVLPTQEPLVVEKLERTEKAYKALTVGSKLSSKILTLGLPSKCELGPPPQHSN